MYQKHAQNYFAMLNNAVAVVDTPLEGGVHKSAFLYYQYLLTAEFPDCPVKFNLTHAHEIAIHQAITNLLEFDQAIDTYQKQMRIDKKNSLNEVIASIFQKSEQSKVCYFPSGWHGNPHGHYASLKFRRIDKGTFALSLLNHGSGISYHQFVKKTGMKEKRLYQSNEYEVDLTSTHGRRLLERIIEIDLQSNFAEAVNPYGPGDLYGLLKLYGREILLTDKLDQKAVTPQRGGTCSITNTHVVAKDVLVNLGADIKERKRFHFVLKLRSILHGFEAYQRGEYARNVLEWALNEFSVRVNKEYRNVLSDTEVIDCGNLHREISERLLSDKRAVIARKSSPEPFPSLIGDAPVLFDKKQKDDSVSGRAEPEYDRGNPAVAPPVISPEKIVELLDMSSLSWEEKTLPRMYHFFQSLPHCSGKAKDEFWDKVPRSHIDSILENMVLISHAVLGWHEGVSPHEKQRIIALSMMMYDIVAQLKTDPIYALGLDPVYSELEIYSDPEVYFTVKRIAKNFQERAKDKKRVLTNQVHHKQNPRDDTVSYVMTKLMNESQRNALMSLLGLTESNDQNLFDKMTALCHTPQGIEQLSEILGNSFFDLIKIASYAQSIELPHGFYTKDIASGGFHFYRSRYFKEIRRKGALREIHSKAPKNLPKIPEMNSNSSHMDFSENTIYHPRDHLQRLMRPDLQNLTHPYQMDLSGSIDPESQPWPMSLQKKPFYIELNEQFRHIECSPNLQVIRTLTWISENPDKMVIPEVLNRVMALIFEFGRLEKAILNQTDSLFDAIDRCFNSLNNYYREEGLCDPDTLSRVGELSTDLQYFIEVTMSLYQMNLGAYAFPSLNQLLFDGILSAKSPKSKSALAKQILKSFRNARALALDDYVSILIARLITTVSRDTGTSDEIWRIFFPVVKSVASSYSHEFNQKFKPMLSKFLGLNIDSDWILDGRNLRVQGEDFIINLESGTIRKRHGSELRDCTQEVLECETQILKRLAIDFTQLKFYADGSTILSSDGKWIFNAFNTSDEIVICSIKQNLTIEGDVHECKSYDLNSIFSAIKSSPFESASFLNQHYQYWNSFTLGDKLFVRQDKSPYAYLYSERLGTILQLKENAEGAWERTGNILLNLSSPRTKMENTWSGRLAPLFGVGNLRCIAALSPDGKTCELKRIEHVILGLNFDVNENQHLVWSEDPDYYISDEIGLMALEGLPSVIQLKNNMGHRRILIPAFALCKGDTNNAFNQSRIIDYDALCHGETKYFEYTQNSEGLLIGKSPESNLYLAILYRSLGDYKKAMNYLRCAETNRHLSELSLSIIQQVLIHKIKSPIGAAFDLKLNHYIKEHLDKWTSDNRSQLKLPHWDEWILSEQIPYYASVLSQYKTGVSILPEYCRLGTDEWPILLMQSEFIVASGKMVSPSERLSRSATLRGQVWGRRDQISWSHHVIQASNYFYVHCQRISDEHGTWRINVDSGKTSCPGFAYLFLHFKQLLEDAISLDPARGDALRIRLYALLMNDKNPTEFLYSLIAVLNFASRYPQFYTDFIFEDIIRNKNISNYDAILNEKQMIEALISKAGLRLQKNQSNISEEHCALLTFENQKETILDELSLESDFNPTSVDFYLAPIIEEEARSAHPLKSLAEKYFDQRLLNVAKGEFKLDAALMKNPSHLEKRLWQQYQRGHEENQKKTRIIYQLKSGVTVTGLKEELTFLRDRDMSTSEEIGESLIKLANRLPDDPSVAYNMILSRSSGQHRFIELTDLFSAFLNQDANALTSMNPHLTQGNVTRIFSKFADYALVCSRRDLINRILDDLDGVDEFELLKPYELQLLASNVDKARAYAVKDFPEFLVYEYASKRLLREDQVLTLTKIIHLIEHDSSSLDVFHHALLQFAAGGGKTSVLIPILAHRFARKGYLPVIFNTNELYGTGLEDIPKNLRDSLNQSMEVIERELEHQWSPEELQKLLKDLERWRRERKCLLLKPVTWHSINIARKLAYLDYHPELAHRAEQVLDFFKFNSVKLEDECQITSDPLQQSIKTFSKPSKIPVEQIDLMIRIYEHLMGVAPQSEEIQRLAGIKTNQKQTVNSEDLKVLQKKLAYVLSQEPCFSSCQDTAFMGYLTTADRKRPDWLHRLHVKDPGTADLVVLARAFLQTHLPYILTMQFNKDYGDSIHEGDLTAAPKHEGKDVTSHFGDHSLVVALTIQLYGQRGLNFKEVEQLLDALMKEHRQEREWNLNKKTPTTAEKWLFLSGLIDPVIKSFKDLSPENRMKISKNPGFTKNPIVVKRFLKQFALPQIDVPRERQSSTPAEFQSGFERSLMLSATPGIPEIYHPTLQRKNCFLEEAFESRVIDTLLSPENSTYCHLSHAQTPSDFFNEIPEDVLATMTTLIDRGALLTDFNGQEVISAYLGLDRSRSRPTSTGVFFSKNKTHIKFESEGLIDIPGTALIETLKKYRIKPEDFLLFLFMDLSKTTGVDIKRPFHDKAGLTVGKGQTVTETIQAAMRERQLLDDNAQTVTWIMFQSLYREINPLAQPNSFDPRDVIIWMIQNEAKQFSSKIISRAYQGIESEIQSIVWKNWRYNPGKMSSHLKKMLRQPQSISPWEIYELESFDIESKKVLNDYKISLLKKYELTNTDDLSRGASERIEKIINETAELIERMQTTTRNQIDNEVQQEIKFETQKEQEQEIQETLKKHIDMANDFRFALETFPESSIDSFFDSKLEPIVLPDSHQIKCPNLLFNREHFSAITPLNAKAPGLFDQIKPIEMIMVKVAQDGARQYRACTAAEAEFYSVILSNTMLSSSDPSFAILTSNGRILTTSLNTDPHACNAWLKSSETQHILTYANFLSGRINNPIHMTQLIKAFDWAQEDYETMVSALEPMRVSNCASNLRTNPVLYRLSGWGTEPSLLMSSYDQTSEPSNTLPRTSLNPSECLEKDSGSFSPPQVVPERALEGYLFNEPVGNINSIETGQFDQLRKCFVELKLECLMLEAEMQALEKPRPDTPDITLHTMIVNHLVTAITEKLQDYSIENDNEISQMIDSLRNEKTLLDDAYNNVPPPVIPKKWYKLF